MIVIRKRRQDVMPWRPWAHKGCHTHGGAPPIPLAADMPEKATPLRGLLFADLEAGLASLLVKLQDDHPVNKMICVK
jgi:hypothetical protein